jgi:hypothetical protein
MTRFLKALLFYPIGKPATHQITCSEAGRKGAQIRNAKAFERKRAVVHQLCAGMGRPVPECFR